MKPRYGSIDFWKIVLLAVSFFYIYYLRHINKIFPFNFVMSDISWHWKGYLYFFLVPVWLWAAGTFFIRRNEKSAKAFAFIAGSDNRLSLSRLQAFVWTLVIFGSFAAAMGIHTKISPVTETQASEYKNSAKFAADQMESRKTLLEKANIDLKDYTDKKAAAEKALNEAKAALETRVKNNAGDTLIKQAQDDVTKKQSDLDTLMTLQNSQAKAVENTQAAMTEAERKKNETEMLANSLNWVVIPASLLALAGIAIGSGIFSSLISAVNSEEKTACVTEIKTFDTGTATVEKDGKGNKTYPPEDKSGKKRLLQIVGIGMGKTGKVRFGKGRIYSAFAPILFWRNDGTEIIVDVPVNDEKFDTLVVDTPNGKLCYELSDNSNSANLSMSIGNAKNYYEFSDLFRDDKNPSSMDLMKFQMFGWTIVAIAVYSYLFLNDLRQDIASLPIVPSSIVILTGLSQAGYLAGKGVSNAPTNENSNN